MQLHIQIMKSRYTNLKRRFSLQKNDFLLIRVRVAFFNFITHIYFTKLNALDLFR